MPEDKQVEQEAEAPKGEHRYVTLEELTTEDSVRDRGETYLPRYGGWIAYRARVPLERIVFWQRRYLGGKKRDMGGMILACLTEVLLEPRVTREQATLLLKADGRVMLEIVNDILGDITEGEEEVLDEVGEL